MTESTSLRWLARAENGIGVFCKVVITLSLCIMFAVLLSSIVLRYFGIGQTFTTSVSELPELLFPWLISAGFVLAVQHGAHLSILFLTARLHGVAQRAAIVLRLLVIVFVYAVLTWKTAEILPIISDEHSAILGVSAGWTYGCLLGGFVLLIAGELIIFTRYVLHGVRPQSTLVTEAA